MGHPRPDEADRGDDPRREAAALKYLAGLILLAALGSAEARAQTSQAPRRLFPPGVVEAPADPRVPRPEAPAETRRLAPVQPPAITTRELAPPSPWQVGALPPTDPLARQPWGDLPVEIVLRLIEALPPPTPVLAPLSLDRRVLVAPAPPGADAALFRARMQALLARGTGGFELARALPPNAAGEMRELVFEAGLLGPRPAEVCDTVQALGPSGAYTTVARIACALVTGDEARAQVLVGVLRERGAPYLSEVEPFATAALAGDGPALAALSGPLRGPALAVLASRPVQGVDAALQRGDAAVAGQLARNPTLGAEARLRAADAAHRLGAVGPQILREALQAGPSDPRAQRLAAIRDAAVPAVRAERLLQAWLLPLSGPERVSWAGVLAADARALEPSVETVGAAPAVVPILLLAGEVDTVRRWDQILRFPGAARPDLRDALAPYLLAAELGEGLDRSGLDARTRSILGGLGRLGTSADPILRALDPRAEDTAPAPPLARLQGLAEAQRRGAPAAVAVLTLLLLGNTPETAPEFTLDTALRALRSAGLGQEALQLAAALLIAGPAPRT